MVTNGSSEDHPITFADRSERPDSQATSIPPLSVLEARMRPDAWSVVGFLGPEESLEAVLSRDEETVARSGVTYEGIADSLHEILLAALEPPRKTVFEWVKLATLRALAPRRFPKSKPGNVVTPRFRIALFYCLGYQECPWGCGTTEYGCLDFEIENRSTSETIRGPGLIIHLIRRHRFFEGVQSPYRVDPEKLIRVLGLVSPASPPPPKTRATQRKGLSRID